MDAIEFVKKYGLSQAKMFVDFYKDNSEGFKYFRIMPNQHQVHKGDRDYDFEYDDLKQIVEAFELVGKAGGLELAKDKIKINAVWCNGGRIFLNTLKQAIELVEKVNASD